ncbi:protein GAMETE EXPRESSED 3 [Panicum miliaceum]|uniref:Protein GAMETE EXPRESSED 3 n=1 Tax=Panicum miliaceum TaxID=4540 RepID=A0A3L6SRR3_PANMI|nr:protein GAMETE EXPRESSED 3 [Panicum miliaceum]
MAEETAVPVFGCSNCSFALATAYAVRTGISTCVVNPSFSGPPPASSNFAGALHSRALAAKPAFFDLERATAPVVPLSPAQHALRTMAMGVPWPLCLLACLLLGAGGVAGNARAPRMVARALSRPLIASDGRVVACSGKDLLAFEGNGSVAWVAPLGLRCNDTISPVSDGKKVYLVAEDRVIKVTPPNVRAAKPASEVFFSYNATPGRSEEIVGLSVTGSYSSLFLTIRNLGLFEFSLEGELQWSLGPVLDWFGYRIGCKGNISGCYFDSAPVLDHSAGALYILNTEGQLYSFNFQSRALRWIQDLTSLDKVMTLAPGSSRCLYIVFPRKSIVVGLDVSTGNISWQKSIGPLSNEKSFPIVDNNGWMSIGSLDGILYSISPDGDVRKLFEETALDSAIPVDPVLDCSGFSMYVSKTVVEGKSIWTTGEYTSVSVMKPSRILVTLLDPANGTIHWTGEYPGKLSSLMSSGDLNDFAVDETLLLTLLSASRFGNATQCDTRSMLLLLSITFIFHYKMVLTSLLCKDKQLLGIAGKIKPSLRKLIQRSLQSKKRSLGKMISELEQQAAEDATSNEALGLLGEMVKAKEGVERKLYASYSLGRDRLGLKQGSSILPLYHGKYKSHSFHSSPDESVHVFNIPSDTSTSEDGSSSCSDDDSESCSSTSSGDTDVDARLKPVEEAGPSNTANVAERVQEECPSDVRSPFHVFTNPSFVEEQCTGSSGNALSQKQKRMETVKGFIPSKRLSLKRRRTSSTHSI